ncbi:DUF2949 domain-containing protein [Gloeocapsa sp. PCC 73106]|uniref:DUF2949 domain-containing protein n=1 Tax=Gloeocapsa sp. PCC 73106 TaxID=102232 RepID=UPI0002ABE4A8|nr:DUF2949 domain-containing protein [Gloeocapsa sp. PCC 73106]ELR97261.1 Protein of unknown function (DUF2949) [Gloeocapsa sp. PCC 73106]
MEFKTEAQLTQFLIEELGISTNSINLAKRQSSSGEAVLPIVLWQYGLVSLSQLATIWDWLETV